MNLSLEGRQSTAAPLFVKIKMMKKNPICTILWNEAFYTFESDIPKEFPFPRLTSGLIIETNDEYTFIATNVAYEKETGSLNPIDGFIIPEKVITEFKKIGNYNE